MYASGDVLALNCTSGKSRPAAQLKWFVNGQQVRATAFKNFLRVTSLARAASRKKIFHKVVTLNRVVPELAVGAHLLYPSGTDIE